MTIEDYAVIAGVILAIAGLFRGLEQRKDEAFAKLSTLLGSDSAIMRAFAASQLPLYFSYRRLRFFWRPYRDQVVHLALSALKERKQEKHVRQALFDALVTMTRGERLCDLMIKLRPQLYGPERRSLGLLREPDMIGCYLDEVIMHGFAFDNIDLTEARLRNGCNLEQASFRGARMYKVQLNDSNLQRADLSDAMIWDASFKITDLRNAKLLTSKVNENTSFEGADIRRASVSEEVWESCKKHVAPNRRTDVKIIYPDDIEL